MLMMPLPQPAAYSLHSSALPEHYQSVISLQYQQRNKPFGYFLSEEKHFLELADTKLSLTIIVWSSSAPAIVWYCDLLSHLHASVKSEILNIWSRTTTTTTNLCPASYIWFQLVKRQSFQETSSVKKRWIYQLQSGREEGFSSYNIFIINPLKILSRGV